ncbi:hypothetical protein [Pseudoalteromonas luteoviolacea]|uniref:hypothetical protein n=1 Tax=Pseudoalteromonas luteoviolacea TaxID=43657 RepID=UPI001B3818EC|nr:hypothetical protein [Pseudoalteromonas luteoviolacea]MBQ4836085.1 hypothetical protein [Pseudoalteromonas luteoviolacea]
MRPNNSFSSIEGLREGDILLCYTNPEKNFVARKIKDATNSEYCHAAIYYGDSFAAESTAKNGMTKGKIEKVDVSSLVSRYDHVAVLRIPDFWDKASVQSLKEFIDSTVVKKAKYNFKGIRNFSKNKKEHEASIYQKLDSRLEDSVNPPCTEKSNYFCSEFVCDCLIHVGRIGKGADVLYQSDVQSPGDLSKDRSFGVFWGYLSSKCNYAVSSSDLFYYQTPYTRLYGS